jgi:hypothetical protein
MVSHEGDFDKGAEFVFRQLARTPSLASDTVS